MTQTALEPTPNERCDPAKAHVASLHACLLCCVDKALVKANQHDNTKKSMASVMTAMPKSPTVEFMS
jgi:hypothetical protein